MQKIDSTNFKAQCSCAPDALEEIQKHAQGGEDCLHVLGYFVESSNFLFEYISNTSKNFISSVDRVIKILYLLLLIYQTGNWSSFVDQCLHISIHIYVVGSTILLIRILRI